MPILCVCPNGHALRVKDKLAGRTATCPTCKQTFAVPESSELAAGEPVEWRMTEPDGRQRGPTVPVIFAQWIAAGDVRPDTPVWRTGWTEWRPAADVADRLPAPLVEPGRSIKSEPSAPQQPEQPSRRNRRRPATYAERRAHRARLRGRYSVLLAVACLVLTAMLAWLLMTGPPPGAPVLPP